MSEPRLIPVLDLLNGVTVQAIAGRRDEYRPVRSTLTESVDPSVVLNQLNNVCRSGTAYIADLDAITGSKPNRCTLAELSRLDLTLMVDAGVRSSADVEELLDLGVAQVIVGLESLPGPDTARALVAEFSGDSLVLSLDLKSGVPLSGHAPWSALSPRAVLDELAEIGFCRWILLDLSAVGMAQGVPTVDLCREWREQRPHDDIITGGGIRNVSDLSPLQAAGASGLLVASALHRGTITRADIVDWQAGRRV